MSSLKTFHNANKVVFLVQQFPEHTLTQIIEMLTMPAIQINTAIWYAVNAGWIEEPDGETGAVKLKAAPLVWDFGPTVEELEEMLLFAFSELAKKETDLEEHYLSNWSVGYAGHDVIIVLKKLINEHKVHEYQLTDPEDLKSTYTFFTLYENGEQMWGAKQFKKQPSGDEKPENESDKIK